MIHNEPVERKVLCSMMQSSYAVANVRGKLDVDCFTDTKRMAIFSAMQTLDEEGKQIDLPTLNTYFQTHTVEPPITLDDLLDIDDGFSAIDLDNEVHTLQQNRKRNRLEVMAIRLMQEAKDLTNDPDVMLENFRNELDVLSQEGQSSIVTIKQSFDTVKSIINDNQQGISHSGTPIGFSFIDDRGGLCPGNLVILAAQSSHGKTSMALTITHNIALNGVPVAYYSMEMPHEELTARMLAMESKINSRAMLTKPLGENDTDSVMWAMESFAEAKVYYDDKANNSIDKIISSIRKLHAKYDIKGVFIDYLQIVGLDDSKSREQAIAKGARRLKNLALELKIWICCLSQLSRNTERKGIDRLRDSGQIGEAADIVIIIDRPELDGKYTLPDPYSGDSHNKAIFDVVKGRSIGLGSMLCDFYPEITYFVEQKSELKKIQSDPFSTRLTEAKMRDLYEHEFD